MVTWKASIGQDGARSIASSSSYVSPREFPRDSETTASPRGCGFALSVPRYSEALGPGVGLLRR